MSDEKQESAAVRFHEVMEGGTESLVSRAKGFKDQLESVRKQYRKNKKMEIVSELDNIISDFNSYFYDLLLLGDENRGKRR